VNPTCPQLAGRDWADERYSDKTRKALIQIDDTKSLYCASIDWPDGRYADDILEAPLGRTISSIPASPGRVAGSAHKRRAG